MIETLEIFWQSPIELRVIILGYITCIIAYCCKVIKNNGK